MTLKDRLRKLRLPSRKKKQVDVPKEWLPKAQSIPIPTTPASKDMVSLEVVTRKKWRVPGLRRFNQLLAFLLIVANFFISQAALMSMTPEIALLFLGNCYICAWGLWKSRGERKKLEDV